MMYKLNYFPIPGRGEVIRLIFSFTKTSFIDNKIPFKEFPELKKSRQFPYGSLPTLEVQDGEKRFVLAQGPAITMYLSKKLGIWPINEQDDAFALSLVLAAEDARVKIAALMSIKGDDRVVKKEEVRKWMLEWQTNISHVLGSKTTFLNKISGADLAIFDILQNWLKIVGLSAEGTLQEYQAHIRSQLNDYYTKSKL